MPFSWLLYIIAGAVLLGVIQAMPLSWLLCIIAGVVLWVVIQATISNYIHTEINKGVRKGIDAQLENTQRAQQSIIRQAEIQRDKIIAEQEVLIRKAEDRLNRVRKRIAFDENAAEKRLEERRKEAKMAYERERNILKGLANDLRIRNPVWVARFIEDLEFQCFHSEYENSSYSTVEKYLSSRKKEDRRRRYEAYHSRYLCAYYESLVPNLAESAKSLAEDEEVEHFDKDGWWLPIKEYNRLTTSERAQLTLDRYISGNKTNWAVGRDYELYCGSIYREEGYLVDQFGVNRQLQDMGRDLICKKENEILIAQCKFWGQNKTIYEKHIAQLFGTTVAYALENGYSVESVLTPQSSSIRVIPVFITSTELSDVAKMFAQMLGVQIRYLPFDPKANCFPRIKCNINGKNHIYHLPSDQMYDQTIIDLAHGEYYVFTTKEAELLGFRRAKHWVAASN